jgi:predicted dehydrogenase
MVKHRVAIIGCGLIGQKRAAALTNQAELVVCADIVLEKAMLLAKQYGADSVSDWNIAINNQYVSIVVVSVTNNLLAEITIAALEAGKHVLVEKPAGISVKELERVIEVQEKSKCLVRVGFNHRYHPALLQAKSIIYSGMVGELMFIRGRYGHGGRVGYNTEWRANPNLSGGGELIDQGVHLIDLSRLFIGDIANIAGQTQNYFWDMPVEDNAFMILNSVGGQTAFLHASCTEWKNLFSFEIYGKGAKLHIDGLGGSYGVERLAYYQMSPNMGPPKTTIWEYPQRDCSWELEMLDFYTDIELGRQPSANLIDARAALQVVETIYQNGMR